MMVQFEQGFVDKAVAMPFVFVGMYLRQVDGFFDKRTEDAGLRKRLPVHLSDPGSGTVCRDHNQWHLLIEGFRYGRMNIKQRTARCTADSSRAAAMQRQSDCEESRTPFIRHRIAGEERVIGNRMYDR